MNKNITIRAELDDLRNMIAKSNPQANHMQQPPSTYQQQFQVQPAPPQGPPSPFAQQPSYVWNGQTWTMAPPMLFQNLTNLPGFQPKQNQKKGHKNPITGLMDGVGIKAESGSLNLLAIVMNPLKPTD
eukprot:5661348-Ditylum_brightwellii.AAC.1